MRLLRTKAFVLFSFVFLTLSGWSYENGREENSSEQKWDIRDLDATQIKLEDIREVAYGKYPCWSPDSKKILYTEEGTLTGGIWMINLDGSKKKKITKDGFLAGWSPNGKRIVYTDSYAGIIEAIAIVDLETKKEYIIWKKERASIFHKVYNLRIEWVTDEKIFFFNEGWSNRTDLIIMNLDDLSIETERPATYEHAAAGNKNLAHPLFNIYLEEEYSDPLIHLDFANYLPSELSLNINQKKKLRGIWAENKKGVPFAVRLLGRSYYSPELSPDFTMLLFDDNPYISGGSDNFSVAKISKSPISHIKHYEVPIGLKDGLKKKDILIVSSPKINPLNNKLIGYDEKELKGSVIVESVEEDKALVRTLLSNEDFKHNHVAVSIKNKAFGYLKEIFKEINKEVLVSPRIIGKPKDGLYIEKIEVIPQRIMIKGPERLIKNDRYVRTSPIDISSWTKSGEVEIDIILPHPNVKIVSLETKPKIRITLVVPLRAVGEIKPPKLLKGVSPVYPEIAKQAGVEGVVILEVTTGVNGKVENVKVLRSIPLLDQAAIDCVRQWVYEPTIVDGKPRRFIHTVTTTFKLPLSFYLEQARRSILMGIAELTSSSGFDTTSGLIGDAIDHLKSGIEAADDKLKVTLKDYTIQLESLKGIKKNYSVAGEMKLREIVKEIKILMEEIKASGADKKYLPVRARGEIKPPRLIKEIKLVYPEIAKQARVEGVVILEVTTDVNGRIENVKVLRSIPLLDQAAVNCIRQWIYEPTLVDGKPSRVIFTVTVAFRLPDKKKQTP